MAVNKQANEISPIDDRIWLRLSSNSGLWVKLSVMCLPGSPFSPR